MVVDFKLVAYRRDMNCGCVHDLKKRHVAGSPKGDHQLSQEGAVARFAVQKGRSAEMDLDGRAKRINGFLCGAEFFLGLDSL